MAKMICPEQEHTHSESEGCYSYGQIMLGYQRWASYLHARPLSPACRWRLVLCLCALMLCIACLGVYL